MMKELFDPKRKENEPKKHTGKEFEKLRIVAIIYYLARNDQLSKIP